MTLERLDGSAPVQPQRWWRRVLASRLNLAINAVQAMTQAGSDDRRIVISTVRQDAAMLCCSVEDNGPGIAAEHVDRLFESFFTTKESGVGMGLPICRSIVEAHGGRIGAEDSAAHGGARFWFTPPLFPGGGRTHQADRDALV
ncbi:ATP-binding protein [Bradyrhizobium guangxiense]|uniref:ATP-binding protein n=1 Tax=Bradyrhizobium guangxiense TaxID=1325115 RepID=UPI0024C0DCF2|nr:ATP-binding protein [Bradyrhizobium guangxiense]